MARPASLTPLDWLAQTEEQRSLCDSVRIEVDSAAQKVSLMATRFDALKQAIIKSEAAELSAEATPGT